ncbi:MAG TPA: TlpA disulfide reductase family protein [Candidatus Eisenbacteria bacterium]|nr:TlpA disulfide reductase family protein [Candidatus Eisenbacteria bacterium]
MNRRRWILAAALLLGAQVALVLLYLRLERERAGRNVPIAMEPRLEQGRDIVVERPDGSRLTIPARSDRYQLVHFWATWCPPCVKEIPSLTGLARRGPSGVRVWAVSADPDWESLREFFGGELPRHVVRDPTGEAASAYSVRQLPDTYLVDPAGLVIARFATRQEWDTAEMRATLERLTAGSEPAR